MELTAKAWLWSVIQHTRGASRDSLFAYYRGQTRRTDLTPEIMNMVNTAAKRCFPSDSAGVGHSSSAMQPPGDLQDWVVDKATCTTYLYYLVAEHVLRQLFPQSAPEQGAAACGRRFKGLMRNAAPTPACSELVACEEFHMPLLECAAQLVAFIAGEEHQQQYPWAAQQLQREACAATLWQAALSFQDCFSSSSDLPLPPAVQQYLKQLQSLLLDSAVLQTGSQVFSVMERGGGCQFREGDASLAVNVLRAYADQAVRRAQLVGWHAQQQQQKETANPNAVASILPSVQLQTATHQGSQNPQEQQQQQLESPAACFHEQCAWLMDKLILNHLDLCFGQHMSVMVACVVYVAAKLVQASLTFKRVGQDAACTPSQELVASPVQHLQIIASCADATPAALLRRAKIIASCVDHTPADLLRQAEVTPALQDSTQAAEYGDVRMFYNARFLPAIESSVRQYLQEYHQQNTAAASTAATDAAGPTGPVLPAAPSGKTAAAAATPAVPERRALSALNANTLNAATGLPADGKCNAASEVFKPWKVSAHGNPSAGVLVGGGSAETPAAAADTIMEDVVQLLPAPGAAAQAGVATAAGKAQGQTEVAFQQQQQQQWRPCRGMRV